MIVLFSRQLLEVYKIKPSNPFVKNRLCARLTHSLEVSVVGRSLGRLVGENNREIPPFTKFMAIK
jgi:dGTP triphosphohydrolase